MNLNDQPAIRHRVLVLGDLQRDLSYALRNSDAKMVVTNCDTMISVLHNVRRAVLDIDAAETIKRERGEI